MKKLFTALAFLFLLANPAHAQYVRVSCATLTPAASFRGTCFDYTSFSLNYWSGSAWIPITGGGGGSGTVTSVATSNGVTGGTITTSGTISGVNAAADGSTKGVAAFTANDFNASTGVISLDYTNGQKASGTQPGFLSSTDWTTFNNKQAAGSYLTAVTADSPLSGSGTSGSHLVIGNAAADGTTKGVASFTANDFDATSGNISLDYTNGQKASASVPGFLSSADWSTFNGKQASGNYITALTGDVTASGPGSVASTIANSAVTLAKIQNAAASSKLLGSGATGSGSPYAEITLGTNLSMSGTTLNAAGGGGTGCTTSGTSILQGDGAGGCSNVTVGSGLDFTGGTLTSTGAAPDTAHYVTTQAESGLSAEFNLGGLTTGLLKHSVSAGVSTPATATADTDYASAFTRTGHGDSDYTIQATDRVVAETASLTAPRTFTLPAASAYPASRPLIIVDEAGGVTSTNTLTVARAGSDTINGATSVVIKAANGGVVLESDGTSKWTMVANTLTAAQACATHQFFNGYNADGTFSCAQPAFTDVSGTAAVAQGGTGLTSGTSGGVLAYTASGTLASSGALTANLPVIGGGAGAAPSVGTRSGNTTAFVTTTGTQTSGDCVKIDANGNHIAAGSPCGSGGAATPIIENIRCSLESGVPFSTSDQIGKTNIYCMPYQGNLLTTFDSGTTWTNHTFTQQTIAVGTLTDATNYDVWCWYNSGIACLIGPAWTSNTSRGTGAGTTEVTTQDGVIVNANAISGACGAKACVLVYTFRTTSTTTTEDSGGGTTTQVGGKRFGWNAFNQAPANLVVIDTTDTWSYGTNSFRIADGATAPNNCVEFVTGAVNFIDVKVGGNASVASGAVAALGIGLSSGTVNSGTIRQYVYNANTSAVDAPMSAKLQVRVAAGYYYLSWLEYAALGTATYVGDSGGVFAQSGLTATLRN